MAMTVADCAAMLEAIAGEDGLDPRQIGVVTQPYTQALERGPDGLRVGVLAEGFEIPEVSEPDVDARVYKPRRSRLRRCSWKRLIPRLCREPEPAVNPLCRPGGSAQ